jgi:hypothetical protein
MKWWRERILGATIAINQKDLECEAALQIEKDDNFFLKSQQQPSLPFESPFLNKQ